MTRDELIHNLAEILDGLLIPSQGKWYHLSTAYEPYAKVMHQLGRSGSLEQHLRAILDTPLPPAPPEVPKVLFVPDYSWEEC